MTKSSPTFEQQGLKHINPNSSCVRAKRNILELLCVHFKSTVSVCLMFLSGDSEGTGLERDGWSSSSSFVCGSHKKTLVQSYSVVGENCRNNA